MLSGLGFSSSGLLPPAPVPLRDRLRAETRDEHEATERALEGTLRVATLAGYRRLLGRLYGFHVVWEPAAASVIADEAFFGARRKLVLIADDLRSLGVTAAEIAALPPISPCPAPRDFADAMGAMYVVEGSTLGGQIIARRLESSLGSAVAGALSYYRPYGPRCGSMWRAFLARLNDEPAGAHDRIVASARATFAGLRRWLCDV